MSGAATPGELLRVRGLCSGYGRSQVLFGMDLDIGPGEIVGMLGRNGMGKTTLVRSVMGLIKPTAGEVVFADARSTQWRRTGWRARASRWFRKAGRYSAT